MQITEVAANSQLIEDFFGFFGPIFIRSRINWTRMHQKPHLREQKATYNLLY